MTSNQSIKTFTGIWVISIFTISLILGEIFVDIFNINQTIGWAFDLIGNQSWITYLFYYPSCAYTVLYLLIFTLNKKETNVFISKAHILVTAICGLLVSFVELDLRILLFFIALSLVMFLQIFMFHYQLKQSHSNVVILTN